MGPIHSGRLKNLRNSHKWSFVGFCLLVMSVPTFSAVPVLSGLAKKRFDSVNGAIMLSINTVQYIDGAMYGTGSPG